MLHRVSSGEGDLVSVSKYFFDKKENFWQAEQLVDHQELDCPLKLFSYINRKKHTSDGKAKKYGLWNKLRKSCKQMCNLTFRHRASCILGQAFHYSPEKAFYYLINKYISLSDICLTVHH